MDDFSAYFGEVDDPRAGNARHNLLELIFVALAAVLCGAEDCTDMAEFARTKLSLLPQVVNLEHGPPSLNTLSRVFRLLDPEPFEAAFARFTAAFAGALEGVVAIDGKALRGAYERGRKATPLQVAKAVLSAFIGIRRRAAHEHDAVTLVGNDGAHRQLRVEIEDEPACRADEAGWIAVFQKA